MPIDASVYGQIQTPKINTPFENLSTILQLRAQQENMRGLKEQREAIAEQRRAQTAKIEQDAADRAAQGEAIKQGGGVRSQTLDWARTNAPNSVPTLTEFFDKADEKASTIKKLKQEAANHEADFLGDIADSVLSHGGTLDALNTGLSYAVEQFPDYAEGAKTLQAHLQGAAPEQVKALLEHVRDTSPARRVKERAPVSVAAGSSLVDPQTGKSIYTAPEKTETPKLGSFEDYAVRYATKLGIDPKKLSAGQMRLAKAEYEAAGRAPTAPKEPKYEWAQTPEGKTAYLTPEEIRKQGASKPLSAMESLDERKYKKAEPVLRGITELSEKINTQAGLLAKMGGGAAKLAAKANYNDDVAEYDALVSGFTPMVARALGHTGVLTQQDVDSVKALFPRPGDSKTLRDRKMSRVLGIISDLEGATSGPAKPMAGGKPKDPLGIR